MPRTTLRAKGQLTLPQSVRKAVHLEEGDPIEVEVVDGAIILRPRKLIDPSQAWFWTPEWQEGEREASQDIAAGRVTRYGRGALCRARTRLQVALPTYDFSARFMREYQRLSVKQKAAFRLAIRRFVEDLRHGQFRAALRVRTVRSAQGVFEITGRRTAERPSRMARVPVRARRTSSGGAAGRIRSWTNRRPADPAQSCCHRRYGISSTLPRFEREPTYRCASAAALRGNVRSMTASILPVETRSSSSDSAAPVPCSAPR